MVVVRTMRQRRSGFTLIEVLACLLVLTLGLTAACGLVFYGLRLVRNAHGKTIGMTTALTVLVDPTPLRTDPTLSPSGPTTSGYLNGLWVVRTESAATPIDGIGGVLVAVTVTVDVYEASNGACYASLSRRLTKRMP